MVEVLTFYRTNGQPLIQLGRRRRQRRPSKAYAARLAKREGVKVEITPNGTIAMTPVGEIVKVEANEWDAVQ